MSANKIWFSQMVWSAILLLPHAAFGNGVSMFVPAQMVGRVETKVVVSSQPMEESKEGVTAKIIIPLELIREELQRIDAKDKREAPGAKELPVQQPRPSLKKQGATPLRTIIAGFAMSLAAVSLVFVVRNKSTVARKGAMLLAGLIVVSGTVVALADLAPPRRKPADLPPIPVVENSDTKVVIEFTSGGFPRSNTVQVILAKPDAPAAEAQTPQRPPQKPASK